MNQSAISIRHLSKKFGEFTAVNDLSLEIGGGEVFGFLGPNGSGKSTTLRMLLTLIKPTAGEIFVLGRSLAAHRKELLREVGSIIEKPDFHLYLSAFRNLKIQAKLLQYCQTLVPDSFGRFPRNPPESPGIPRNPPESGRQKS